LVTQHQKYPINDSIFVEKGYSTYNFRYFNKFYILLYVILKNVIFLKLINGNFIFVSFYLYINIKIKTILICIIKIIYFCGFIIRSCLNKSRGPNVSAYLCQNKWNSQNIGFVFLADRWLDGWMDGSATAWVIKLAKCPSRAVSSASLLARSIRFMAC